MTVGGQQDKEEDTVTAVAVGQIPAAQQLQEHTGSRPRGERFKGQRGHNRQREAITYALESQLHETMKMSTMEVTNTEKV